MDPWSLFLSFVFGSIGFGFFIYGKKQGKYVPLVVGIALMVYPYFVSNMGLMIGIGIVLTALPFVLSR